MFLRAAELAEAHEAEHEAHLATLGGAANCEALCDADGRIVIPGTPPVKVCAREEDGAFVVVCRHATKSVCPRARQLRAAEQRVRDAALVASMEAMRVPRRFWTAVFDGAADTQAVSEARTYAAGDVTRGRALVLTGATGVGKTYAAVCVMRASAGVGMRVRFMDAGDLLETAREEAAWREMTDADFLVVDDLGTEYANDKGGWAKGRLDRLFRDRHGQQRATVITTNLSPAELVQRYDSRIVSRLREWSGGALAEVGGSDLRGVTA